MDAVGACVGFSEAAVLFFGSPELAPSLESRSVERLSTGRRHESPLLFFSFSLGRFRRSLRLPLDPSEDLWWSRLRWRLRSLVVDEDLLLLR